MAVGGQWIIPERVERIVGFRVRHTNLGTSTTSSEISVYLNEVNVRRNL